MSGPLPRYGMELVVGESEGRPTAFHVLQLLEDVAPVREGIVRRRLLTISGACPCGVRHPEMPRGVRDRIGVVQSVADAPTWSVDPEHAGGCEADAPEVLADVAALRERW